MINLKSWENKEFLKTVLKCLSICTLIGIYIAWDEVYPTFEDYFFLILGSIIMFGTPYIIFNVIVANSKRYHLYISEGVLKYKNKRYDISRSKVWIIYNTNRRSRAKLYIQEEEFGIRTELKLGKIYPSAGLICKKYLDKWNKESMLDYNQEDILKDEIFKQKEDKSFENNHEEVIVKDNIRQRRLELKGRSIFGMISGFFVLGEIYKDFSLLFSIPLNKAVDMNLVKNIPLPPHVYDVRIDGNNLELLSNAKYVDLFIVEDFLEEVFEVLKEYDYQTDLTNNKEITQESHSIIPFILLTVGATILGILMSMLIFRRQLGQFLLTNEGSIFVEDVTKYYFFILPLVIISVSAVVLEKMQVFNYFDEKYRKKLITSGTIIGAISMILTHFFYIIYNARKLISTEIPYTLNGYSQSVEYLKEAEIFGLLESNIIYTVMAFIGLGLVFVLIRRDEKK